MVFGVNKALYEPDEFWNVQFSSPVMENIGLLTFKMYNDFENLEILCKPRLTACVTSKHTFLGSALPLQWVLTLRLTDTLFVCSLSWIKLAIGQFG